ncbi:hypothetical protein N9933_01175 [bacterium]|nr:hypothetical protein [bacterium]
MKVSEVIQRIQSLYSKGVDSDNSRLSPRHIVNKVNTVRAKLLSQDKRRRIVFSQWSYQTLPCVKLISAPLSECPCVPETGCEILKSEFPIPSLIIGLNQHSIQSVTSIDGEVSYSATTWLAMKSEDGRKFTSKKPSYFIKDDHLYIPHRGGPKILTISAVFENPDEAYVFPSYCGDYPCTEGDCPECVAIVDRVYPCESKLLEDIITISVQELVVMFSKSVEDLTNDTKDGLRQQSK